MSQQQHDAIKAILLERQYQDERWADSRSHGHHETGAYLTFIQYYVTRAIDEITADDDAAVGHSIRKIAALAVACMEDNGISERI